MAQKSVIQQASDTTVRIATLTALPIVLKQLGYDPAVLLAEQGFQLSLFDNPENMISYARRSQLIGYCVNKTGCSHLGLLLGEHIGLTSLGLLGGLMQQSKDVSTALHAFVRYMHLHVRGAVVYLEEKDDIAFLGYSIIQPGVVSREQIEDGAVTIAFNILRELCGTAWQPLNALFAHHKPKDSRPFQQFFKVPLIFDTERNGILFSARWLQQPVMDADPEQGRQLQRQIDKLENNFSDNFAEQVRRILHPSLLTQQATVDHLSALLSIHPRTMNRRLNACGTSFQKLVNQSRFEISQQLLENSTMKLNQIAETLGYADASVFTRAFRCWSGMAPSIWRERHQQRPAE